MHTANTPQRSLFLLASFLTQCRPGSCLACLIVFTATLATASTALAWGRGHRDITEGALKALPQWEKDLLGEELDLLGRQHCIIPDQVFTRKETRSTP